MNLRFYLYASEPGAFYYTYPNGAGTRPVPEVYTDAELAENTQKRDATYAEWRDVDPEGYRLWRAATAAMKSGDSSQLESDWSRGMLKNHRVQIVDPCRFCASCRSRRQREE
ncbi:hypothetical protein [Streptomyces sp. 4F14]|uniref:hypothetical protein n=1 Tax=Streptomyces sp. 4F14 TaxID=3394380 RepID=UPI003A84F525